MGDNAMVYWWRFINCLWLQLLLILMVCELANSSSGTRSLYTTSNRMMMMPLSASCFLAPSPFLSSSRHRPIARLLLSKMDMQQGSSQVGEMKLQLVDDSYSIFLSFLLPGHLTVKGIKGEW